MEEGRTWAADALPLTEGMTVEVMTIKNQITFVGKVESYAGGVLTVRASTGGELPPVLFNREVKLRFFRGNQSIIAGASVCGSSPWLWKLDRLERLFEQEHRVFFRQNVDREAKVQCVEPPPAEEDKEASPQPCRILDISASGLRLSTREIYQEGDLLLVTGLVFVRGEEPFVLHCRVRRAQNEGGGRFLYGCQIEDLSEREQDRLLRTIFIVQRNERQNQKDRD